MKPRSRKTVVQSPTATANQRVHAHRRTDLAGVALAAAAVIAAVAEPAVPVGVVPVHGPLALQTARGAHEPCRGSWRAQRDPHVTRGPRALVVGRRPVALIVGPEGKVIHWHWSVDSPL